MAALHILFMSIHLLPASAGDGFAGQSTRPTEADLIAGRSRPVRVFLVPPDQLGRKPEVCPAQRKSGWRGSSGAYLELDGDDQLVFLNAA